ncbi:hypothetical protein AMS68_005339 [Peltaster fructicola]|uniref:Autophagy-related protein 9 n=1 Tax=Peltaster fructicola TaxID=286661 RepID=A0A6H0XYH1_9PEZI|nr:hypothetical protein AMS68_005339 [Peltaster fructicola]
MMASKMLSRLLPVAEGDVSMYESMRYHADVRPDIEGQYRRDPDDDDDPEDMLYDASIHARPFRDNAFSPQTQPSLSSSPILERTRALWSAHKGKRRLDDDDDVPESLLLDGKDQTGTIVEEQPEHKAMKAAAQWHTAQRPSVHHIPRPVRSDHSRDAHPAYPARSKAQSQAMWLYTNASNLDAFLLEVYQYYVQHGVWSVILSKAINQLTEMFVFSFAMFLSTCIDYSKIPSSKSTGEVMIPKCMAEASWVKNAALFTFIMYWLITLANNIRLGRRAFRMHDFYLHVLSINDDDIQTISWVRVVDGLVRVQNANVETANPPAKIKKYLDYHKPQQRLNAETIANRLMRQANYYVAMYNKDLLDFTLPIPFLGERHFYSKSLEWSIDFCLTNFIFDEQGSIRPFCLDVKNRGALVEALRRRLQFAALTSVVLAPWNILRFCIMYFFRYYTEFTRNPSRVSARTFTPFAEWKIREFNELDHLFERRMRQAHPFAIEYLKQFPKDKMDQAWRFIAFISGAVAAVLTIATLLDPELFLGFEVTPGRTAVFWLTVMVGIFGVAHGSLPDETEVHDPVLHLREVLMYTHYMPARWKGKLHSNEVRTEFSSLYQMKIVIFLEEILSLVLAPWILWRNSGKRCERIIDFFREHTVHVDGIGNQCNFAVFGFRKDLDAEDATAVLQEPDGLRDDYYGLKDEKMAASIQNFAQYYSHYNNNARHGGRRAPNWQPPPTWPRMLNDNIVEEQSNMPAPEAKGSARTSSAVRRSKVIDGHRVASSYLARSPQPIPRRPAKRAERDAGVVHGVSESRLMAQDSDLDDYDKAVGEDSGSDEDAPKVPGEKAGVLGMLYQFSKAHTEKGTGVQI